MNMYMYTYTHTHLSVNVLMYVYVCMFSVSVYVFVCVSISVHVCAHIETYLYLQVYVSVALLAYAIPKSNHDPFNAARSERRRSAAWQPQPPWGRCASQWQSQRCGGGHAAHAAHPSVVPAGRPNTRGTSFRKRRSLFRRSRISLHSEIFATMQSPKYPGGCNAL